MLTPPTHTNNTSNTSNTSKLALEFSFQLPATHHAPTSASHSFYPIGEVLFHGRKRLRNEGLQVQSASLDARGDFLERWLCDTPMTAVADGDIRYAFNQDLLFGAIDLLDTADTSDAANISEQHPPNAHPISALQKTTQRAYEELFSLLDTQGFTHVLRIWNYLPQINQETLGLERYRQFNIGRQDAFIAAKREAFKGAPAACALGSQGDHLVIYFIAARQQPIAIENPRQISAYHYPTQYGPKAPTFSRASITHTGKQSLFFISGTASIVGHESVHVGDVVGQTQETFNNLDVLIESANASMTSATSTTSMNLPEEPVPWSYAQLYLKVYVRHAAHLPKIQQVLAQRAPAAQHIAYLQADICRDDLLVEIEATGIRDN
jgi:chorismate lyase / 3-hydroxybenzoate synthase